MQQLPVVLLCLGALTMYGQSPASSLETNANKRIELAQRDLERVNTLVGMGALPRLRVQEAEQNLADAQDDAVLARTLYSDLQAKDLTDQVVDEMVAAAQRQVERQQARLDLAKRLVDEGLSAISSLTPLQTELSLRQTGLDLAKSHARMLRDLAELAKLEQSIAQSQEAARAESSDVLTQDMEHFEGSGIFRESRDLKLIESAFAREFDRPLPISADGETSLHRALGFDHRGRVDVAVYPNAPEGIWLRGYLKSRLIPYYAFTHAMAGKATAAHIHIGPGSTRLTSAD
jgi:hypothetical protein